MSDNLITCACWHCSVGGKLAAMAAGLPDEAERERDALVCLSMEQFARCDNLES